MPGIVVAAVVVDHNLLLFRFVVVHVSYLFIIVLCSDGGALPFILAAV